tara:strand:+ start:35483 stop:37825 length:2343 start_codon:yes stop_codon:yes gene_type:complete
MKYLFRVSIFFICLKCWAQVDYSSRWGEHYSYNHVVDFVKQPEAIYSITESCVFAYDLITDEITKTSSVDGLSGNLTSSICYSSSEKKLIIGYDNGLIEILDENNTIKRVVDVFLSDISTEKRINSIYEYDNKLYLSVPFGVVVYNLLDLEFEDTYFIGENSTSVKVNSVIIINGYIYAASSNGVYIADASSNLNDSNNWIKTFSGEFFQTNEFNGDLLVSKGNSVYSIVNNAMLDLKISVGSKIVDMNSTISNINLATSEQGFIYGIDYGLEVSTNDSPSFTVSSIYSDNEFVYLGSEERGVLKSSLLFPNDFSEIHPEGPVSNDIFSMTVNKKDIWVVYGAYDFYAPEGLKRPVDHYNGTNWVNIPVDELTINNQSPVEDLVHVTVDPLNSDKVYISSWAAGNGDADSIDKGGVLVLQNDTFYDFWNVENSGLTNLIFPNSNPDKVYTTTRVGNTVFDSKGNLWLINSLVYDGSGALKKLSSDGEWTGHELTRNTSHYDELVVDEIGNIWVGSQEEGMLVYNEDFEGKIEKAELNISVGGLPENRVKAIAVGIDGNIWVGTLNGVVLFSDVENVYSESFQDAEPIIIEKDGEASILLDGANMNDILIDGAGNVWFATSNGGVLKTNSTGKKILEGFNTDNSPLPSNDVLKISMDESTGTVYFGTSKGILSYKTGVASYGENLTDVYAYPNPALKQHNQVSIVGKSSNFPLGANVKILDVAGNLVYESSAIESQSELGGKFVWDKTNLAGTKVASGVYIVLVYDADNNQTTSTKIAIIN